jgi:hypothetical protein
MDQHEETADRPAPEIDLAAAGYFVSVTSDDFPSGPLQPQVWRRRRARASMISHIRTMERYSRK